MAKQRPVASVGPADQHNIIGAGSTVEGTLRGGGNVHVAGTIKGNVMVDGRTVVMPGGVVDGELISTSAEIGGHIKGQVTCRERLVLKPTAVIEGDIKTAKLVIEDGATFNGGCQMGAQGAASGASQERQRRILEAGKEAA